MATIIMLTTTAMNYVNSIDYAGTGVCIHVCIEETLIIVSFMPSNYVASVGNSKLTLVTIVVLPWW